MILSVTPKELLEWDHSNNDDDDGDEDDVLSSEGAQGETVVQMSS